MNREKLLKAAWRHVPRNMKGSGPDRTIVRHGKLVPIGELHDSDLCSLIPHAELGRAIFDDEKIYRAMKRESAKHRMPERFRTDLTKHDRKFLREHDGREPFGWILYCNGTTLLRAAGADQKSRDNVRKVGDAFRGGEMGDVGGFYLYLPHRGFHEVTPERWIEALTERCGFCGSYSGTTTDHDRGDGYERCVDCGAA